MKFYKVSKTENTFAWRQAFTILQVRFIRPEGKMFCHVILFQVFSSMILFCKLHWCCVPAWWWLILLEVLMLCTSVCCWLFYYVILYLFLSYSWTSCRHRCCGAWGYLLVIFSSGMECRTLSKICARLYLSIFLFRVRLFTLIYM